MKFISLKSCPIQYISIIGLFLSSSLSWSASAVEQDLTCFSREEAANLLSDAIKSGDEARRLAVEQQIMDACGIVQQTPATSAAITKKALQALNNSAQKITNWPSQIFYNATGNTFYEQFSGCGYHPQRREGTCSVELRRRWGYGGVPATNLGSDEWSAFCVFGLPTNPNGWTLQNVSAVHVHDEPFGWQPSWYYTITNQAEANLHTTAVNGMTYLAKNILSWNIRPTSCFFNPVWGHEAYYRIKLDP